MIEPKGFRFWLLRKLHRCHHCGSKLEKANPKCLQLFMILARETDPKLDMYWCEECKVIIGYET